MLRHRTGRWIRTAGFGRANGLFGYVRNIDTDLCPAARSAGLKVVVDQIIAPYEIERAEAAKQHERFPDWGGELSDGSGEALVATEHRTWELADRVTCASDYVRDGLVACGVPAGKVVVEPYPFDSRSIPPVDRRGRSGPVTVGFVGSVGARKGVPYLLQLARRFDPEKVRFVVVGPPAVRPDVLERHRGPAEIVGPVPRSGVAAWLERFDVFLLPSTCEGSAGVVAEAMASGLPVVVSPNTGAPITPGVEGFVAAYDDLDGLDQHIRQLVADADRRHAMGEAGRRRIEQHHLDHYGRRLAGVFGELLAG
jgi:glycosyltransferase involved in cell wall biosynthesis